MKICFVISYTGFGGVSCALMNTVDALLQNTNCEITMLFHSAPSEKTFTDWLNRHLNINVRIYYPLAEKFEKIKDKTHYFPLSFLRKIVFGTYKRFRDIVMSLYVMRNKFDAVIDWVSAESYKQTRFIRNVPKITWLHCSFDYAKEHNLIHRFEHYDKVVCLTDAGKNAFEACYPKFKGRLTRIYNPLDINHINAESRKMPKYTGDYFVCVGRLDNDKDTATIINAFDCFYRRENRPNITMVFIGTGNNLESMRVLAADKESKNNIVFLGQIAKPYGYMRGSIIHILSSYSEGLPTVLIEAMASGTLNVSSDCPYGPREILMDGRAGFLFPSGNSDELSKIMSSVYHGVPRDKMISIGRRSLKRFDAKTIANEIMKLLQSMSTGK